MNFKTFLHDSHPVSDTKKLWFKVIEASDNLATTL